MTIRKVPAIVLFILLLTALHVRADTEPARILILPWKVHAEPRYSYIGDALQDMLSTRIGSHPGVELARTGLVRDRLPEDTVITEDVAERIGKELGAGYVLFGSLSILGEHISMDAKLVDVKTGKITPIYRKSRGVGTVVDMADAISRDVLMAMDVLKEEERPVYRGKFMVSAEEGPEEKPLPEEYTPARPQAKRVHFVKAMELDRDVRDIELYDLTGDGRKELLALTEDELLIFSIEGKTLKRLHSLATGGGNISMDVADGILYVSRLGRSSPDSCMVWYDGGLKKRCGIPYLVRVIRADGKPLVAGQVFRREWGYTGPVVALEKEGHTLKNREELGLPRGVTLYGFELCRLAEDEPYAILWLDRKGHLRVYTVSGGDGFSERWRSSTMYGGTITWIKLEEREGIIPFESRFYCADIDRDRTTELVIKKNTPGGIFGKWAEVKRFFKSGSVRVLEWHGVSFSEEWKTDELTPYVADFVLTDLDGKDSLVVVTSEKARFRAREKSSILFYKIGL